MCIFMLKHVPEVAKVRRLGAAGPPDADVSHSQVHAEISVPLNCRPALIGGSTNLAGNELCTWSVPDGPYQLKAVLPAVSV